MKPLQKLSFHRMILLGWMILSLSSASGCCCRFMTDCYAEKIDVINDNLSEVDFDNWYHPECDLSRIGQPDWCRSRLNRILLPDACCKGCVNKCYLCGLRGCDTCDNCYGHECGCQNCQCQECHCQKSGCQECADCQSTMPCAMYQTTPVQELPSDLSEEIPEYNQATPESAIPEAPAVDSEDSTPSEDQFLPPILPRQQ